MIRLNSAIIIHATGTSDDPDRPVVVLIVEFEEKDTIYSMQKVLARVYTRCHALTISPVVMKVYLVT